MINQSPLQLTQQQAIAFTLRQQRLTQPAELPLETVRQVIAIQAQYSAGVPIALWARNATLSQDWVDRALYEARVFVKTWCLRGTIHMLASADLPMMVQAIGQHLADEHEVFMKTRRGVDRQELLQINEAILDALDQRPLTRSELHEAVPRLASIESTSWGLDVKGLAYSGELVAADSVNNETRFARRSVWLAELPWELPSQEAAQQALLLRYLAAYGPATMQDFAHWTGMKMKTVKDIFDRSAPDLIRTDIAGWRGENYIRSQDEPLIGIETEELPAVSFLPKFDPLLMGYRDKTRFIDDEHLPLVYRPAAQVEAVILLRGRAAATWRVNSQGRQLKMSISLFRPLNRDELTQVESKAEQLTAFLGGKKLNLTFSLLV